MSSPGVVACVAILLHHLLEAFDGPQASAASFRGTDDEGRTIVRSAPENRHVDCLSTLMEAPE